MSRKSHGFRPPSPRSRKGRDSDAPQARPPVTAPARPFETFEATFLGHPEGTGGFLRPVGVRKGAGMDLLVDWRDALGAIHGDRVMAEVAGDSRDGRLRGRVVKILARGEQPLPALLQHQAWGWRAVPLEPRLSQIISVPPTDLAEDGDLVSVKLNSDLGGPPSAQQLRGVVVAKLGRPTDLKIENKLTAALYHLRTDFPQAVMDELAPFPTVIPETWLAGREDLRELLTVTVDPPTAQDFDDAISLEPLPENEGGGWRLGVHIADVSHYVREGGPLDQEAQTRGTSVYFPDESIPMLPERLSGELCSLREGVDRLALTVWMTVSPDLEMVETRFSESVIKSRRRLTYDQVKVACLDLEARARHDLGEDVCELLDQSLVLSRRLNEARLARGAMNLDSEETEFLFDDEGRPVDARRYAHHDAHRMIEAFMLLANEAVATFFSRRKVPTIYRIHDEPDPLKLEAFKEVAMAFGLLRPHDAPTPENLNALLDKIRGGPLEAMLNAMLLRSLKRAEYSVDNIGHSGLALHDYLHFTSPIRRYPDLIVHRWLKRLLHGAPVPEGLHTQLAIVAKQSTDTEQTATEAERENDRWKTCLLMKPKIGQKFDGRIQGFSPKVAFVRLASPFVEVGVPLGALGGAFTVNEARTHTTNGTLVLSIGDPVKVEITGVDEDLRRVSAWIVEAQGADPKGKRTAFVPSLAAPATLREGDFAEEKRPSPRASHRPAERSSERPARKGDFRKPSASPRSGGRASSRAPKGSVRGGGRKRG
ncbi:MAG: VacB/RNase II family 3'-5' exoribonuclease [Firmicutes bacterium]|nr:VacB/RNase II family 3'-5' exoribonuclease [Bacillota bacterium]